MILDQWLGYRIPKTNISTISSYILNIRKLTINHPNVLRLNFLRDMGYKRSITKRLTPTTPILDKWLIENMQNGLIVTVFYL
jgi:hypothetical protein